MRSSAESGVVWSRIAVPDEGWPPIEHDPLDAPAGLPRPGERVLHYEIVETIGRGGMGVVFRARDSRLGRDVALKCPWPRLSSDVVGRHRFLREARATSRLAHPTIVPVYEVFEDRELPWIAMELVEGKALSEVLEGGEPLPLDRILQHAEDLTDALRAAHAKGILHRDIKPGNVLIGADGRARLTDFGLARFFAPSDQAPEVPTEGASQVTEEGKVVGTIAYMAPETLMGAPPDPRSDLFSLGVIVYEMCTGRAAFGPSSKWDAYQAVLHREPSAIGRFNYEIPRSLERIVRKALTKRPDERYQDARDMLADIRTVKRRIASGTWDLEDDLDVGRTRHRRVLWGLLGLSAASLGVAAWMGLQSPAETAPSLRGTPRLLTSAPGTESEPAISPTGNLIAYASDESGNLDLWLIDSRGGSPLRLTDDPRPDHTPAWFPDGSALAFVSERGGVAGIWKVATLGGSATLLVANATAPAISPDGKRIAFTRPGPKGDSRVMVAPLDAPDRAATLCKEDVGQWGQFTPAWSHDGERIAFADFNHLWVATVADGRARQVTDGRAFDRGPVWSSDDRSIHFSSYREETFALWSVEIGSGRLERLTYGSGPEVEPSLDRRGSKLVFSTHAGDANIFVRSIASGLTTRVAGYREDLHAAFSHDGKRLVFTTDRWGGEGSVAVHDIESGVARKLSDVPAALPRFSPDDRWLAFWRVVDGSRDIWVMPSDGGEMIRVTDDPAADIQPSWSPDGQRIVFVSERDGGSHLWIGGVRDGRPHGAPHRVTSGPATDMVPEWSPDARTIAFLRSDQFSSDVWIVDAVDGRERRLTVGAQASLLRWTGAGRRILVCGLWGGATYEIRDLDVATGRVQSLSPPAMLGREEGLAHFDVDATGSLLVYNLRDERGDVWMIEASPGRF